MTVLTSRLALSERVGGGGRGEDGDAIRAGETFAFDPLILTHVGGGGLILAFVIWRLGLRLKRGVPAAPQNEPAPLNPS